MSDSWVFYDFAFQEWRAFTYVNAGIHATVKDAPTREALISLTYKTPRENGLPGQEEFEAVCEVEDKLEEFAIRRGDVYVGRVTVRGKRHFHVYVGSSEEVWREFIEMLARQSGYEIALKFGDDPEHQRYYEFLYPGPEEWQIIKDREVLAVLAKQGDVREIERDVDHWVYFPSRAAAADFVIWAEGDRFTELTEHSGDTEDGRYRVRLRQRGDMTLDSIHDHTLTLHRKAVEFGGEYDGWETSVEKGPEG
jgi:hypothetical protein